MAKKKANGTTYESQRKAVNKYIRENYDRITIRLPKGEREKLQSGAKELGYESFNQFCIDSMREKIKSED